MFGLNDIFKYIEKHQQSQRQGWADTLSEIVLEGKERTRIEKLEDLLSQNPPLPEAVYNQLLCLHEQGFLLPRRYESNFFKMYYHREKLKHLRQTYEKENSVFFENELEYTLNDNSERSRQLGAACPLDLRPLEGFPLFISYLWGTSWRGGGLDFKSPKFWPLPLFLPTPIGSTIYK